MAQVEGGYDYAFLDPPPDRLVCKICQCPCREAQLTECCGHPFCKCCLNKLMSSTTVSHACPMCRVESCNAFAHHQADREIKSLKVYCPNKEDGCDWIGELRDIVAHAPPQKCTRCEKCDDVIHCSDRPTHLPDKCPCYCPHCGLTEKRREVIIREHKANCHKFPVRCPNNCGDKSIPRESMDDHKEKCPLEMIQCKYQCGMMIARKEVEKHNLEKITKHMQLSVEKATRNAVNEQTS